MNEIEDGELVDAEAVSLLSAHEHQVFSQKTFWLRGDNPSTYKIGDNSYVYVARNLRAALNVVREIAARPIEDRRKFVLNPRRMLAERLQEQQAGLVESSFVETQQFSERVTGIDVWSKPVLPWIKPLKSSWVPEKFGIRVGDLNIELSSEEVRELAPKLERGLSAGIETIKVAGEDVPVTAQAHEALRQLIAFLDSIPGAPREGLPAGDDRPEKISQPGPMFLTIRDNLERVEYVDAQAETTAIAPGPIIIPHALITRLKPHQREGLAWLQTVSAWGAGAILADDMGLGKTLQCLCFLASRKEQRRADGARPALIVAPTALIENWKSEIDRHFKSASFGLIGEVTGSQLRYLKSDLQASGRDIELGRATLDASRLSEFGLVLTTYETLRDYHMSFARVPFDVVVFDEAQKAKNPTSQLTRSAKTINARFKLALTGTPVENRLHDLWSIIDVVWPGRLGSSRDFARKYEVNPSEGALLLRTELMEGNPRNPPLILRRMKSGHLEEFPAKKFEVYPVEMPPDQAAAYADCVRDALATRDQAQRGRMLEILQRLRSVSLHPFEPHASVSPEAFVQQSGRLIALMQILEKVRASGDKALIFVEHLVMQDFVARYVAERFGFREPLSRIHGGIPGPLRQKIVDGFQSKQPGFDALVLSPKAGGVGLNITAANHVIHLSRWWNPAVEDQATDRVYRIGQTKDVVVHIPQSIHPNPAIRQTSFDLRLDALLRRKRNLSGTLLLPMDDSAFAAELYSGIFTPAAEETNLSNVPISTAPDNADVGRSAADESGKTIARPEPPIRKILSLRDLVQQNTPLKEGHWEFMPNQTRKLDDVFGFLIGQTVALVDIRDPYALTLGTRKYLDDLLAAIAQRATLVQAIRIHALSANHHKVRDQMGADSNAQIIRVWKDMVKARLGVGCEALQKLEDQGGPGFHDRWVDFNLRLAGGDKKYRLHLSSGVLGLISARGECNVFLTGR